MMPRSASLLTALVHGPLRRLLPLAAAVALALLPVESQAAPPADAAYPGQYSLPPLGGWLAAPERLPPPAFARPMGGGGCNSYGCWRGGGGCNSYGCWHTPTGGCNSYGCWASPYGGCNSYGCSEYGKCNSYGCPKTGRPGGSCNSYGCWPGGGGCNSYGCWSYPSGSCNSYGCSERGACNSYGCP